MVSRYLSGQTMKTMVAGVKEGVGEAATVAVLPDGPLHLRRHRQVGTAGSRHYIDGCHDSLTEAEVTPSNC